MTETVKAKRVMIIGGSVILFIVSAVCLSNAAQEMPQSKDDFWSECGIIVKNNIFSRDRGRSYTETKAPSDQTVRRSLPPVLESYFVLKGVTKEDDIFLAFFEDLRGDEIISVMTDDSIAGGKITKLTLDSVLYQKDANMVSVKIGQTLEGKSGSTVLTFDNLLEWSQTQSNASGAIDANQVDTPSVEDADILKKLMERRKQQVGD